MRLASLAVLAACALGATARQLQAEVKGNWTAQVTSEQGTLLLAITPMGAEQTDSAEACKKLCEGMGVACLAWAWCDAATIGGCPVNFGLAGNHTFEAGFCQLTGDTSTVSFSMFYSKGPSVNFTSGIRVFDAAWAPTPASAALEQPAAAAATVADLPPDLRGCGTGSSLLAYMDGEPDPGLMQEAVAATKRDWGLDCKPGKPVLACVNRWSPTSKFVAFQADCSSAGTKLLQGWTALGRLAFGGPISP